MVLPPLFFLLFFPFAFPFRFGRIDDLSFSFFLFFLVIYISHVRYPIYNSHPPASHRQRPSDYFGRFRAISDMRRTTRQDRRLSSEQSLTESGAPVTVASYESSGMMSMPDRGFCFPGRRMRLRNHVRLSCPRMCLITPRSRCGRMREWSVRRCCLPNEVLDG